MHAHTYDKVDRLLDTSFSNYSLILYALVMHTFSCLLAVVILVTHCICMYIPINRNYRIWCTDSLMCTLHNLFHNNVGWGTSSNRTKVMGKEKHTFRFVSVFQDGMIGV